MSSVVPPCARTATTAASAFAAGVRPAITPPEASRPARPADRLKRARSVRDGVAVGMYVQAARSGTGAGRVLLFIVPPRQPRRLSAAAVNPADQLGRRISLRQVDARHAST